MSTIAKTYNNLTDTERHDLINAIINMYEVDNRTVETAINTIEKFAIKANVTIKEVEEWFN